MLGMVAIGYGSVKQEKHIKQDNVNKVISISQIFATKNILLQPAYSTGKYGSFKINVSKPFPVLMMTFLVTEQNQTSLRKPMIWLTWLPTLCDKRGLIQMCCCVYCMLV